jgi:CSLREA domain-containing protein
MNAARFAMHASCLLVLLPASAGAFDFVVTRYDDPAPDGCLAADCSLREAVIAANVAADADRILLSGGTYRLTLAGSGEGDAATGDLDIKKDLEILGLGANLTRIDAQGMGEQPIQSSNSGTDLVLRKLAFQHSDTGALSLGIGTQLIEDCEIRDNGTTANHIAILASIGSALTMRRTTVSGNTGVGVQLLQQAASLENVTISGNGASELLVNLAVGFSCTHCTIVDPADSDTEVTVFDSTLELANTIVAGDCVLGAGGAIDSLGGNVESAGNTCQFDQASDTVGASSGALALGALADNGGPSGTRTHLPSAASTATGAANDALCLGDDQRGVVRETNCESGSVERTNAVVPSFIFIDDFLQGSTGAWSLAVP